MKLKKNLIFGIHLLISAERAVNHVFTISIFEILTKTIFPIKLFVDYDVIINGKNAKNFLVGK